MNLIYFPENMLKPCGGPAGYLYNLKQGMTEQESKQIVFLPAKKGITGKDRVKGILPKRLVDFRKALRFTKMYKEKQTPPVDLNLYDSVHFHRTGDLYRCRAALEKYTGKVILTSHTPCVRFRELIDMLNPADAKLMKKKLQTLEKIDEYAFKRADYIIFPCKEAEEPYYHTWRQYGQLREEQKYRYIPTGIIGCTAKVSREEYRKMYDIPDEAFVISYAGRHNEIKGYADLKKLGEKLLRNENVYFLIAGKEEPIKGLHHPRWIEVGWTNDPHSLIAAADMFILPNHETYFDLIMLEALSLGQIVVASKTGGNKFFEKYDSDGIQLYENIGEAYSMITDIMESNQNHLREMREKNMQLFMQEFNITKFAGEYVEVIQAINSQSRKRAKCVE